jgi:hypothetical protein
MRHQVDQRVTEGKYARAATAQIRTVASLFAGTLLVGHSVAQSANPSGYEFKGGYPTPETIQKAYDDDLSRAIEAYKFFYPTVSIVGTWKGNIRAGNIPNGTILLMFRKARRVRR